MTNEALQHAFNAACDERDTALRLVQQLEVTVSELSVANAQMRARLRVVELMEEQAANRLGFQIPVRLVGEEEHSLRVVGQ